MIKLTCYHGANHAGEYFRLQLQGGDAPAAPVLTPPVLGAQWVGPALAQLGLGPFTTPTATHLVRLARGRHPVHGTQLAPAVNRTRAFYDVTTAAPKTVSLALIQPDHPTAKAIMKAHMLAVHRVAQEVGQYMIRGQSQSAPKAAQWLGLVIGHTHTREGDPHLHSHFLVPNLMLARSGDWRALQIDIGGPNRLRLGLLYHHELSRHLRQAGLGSELVMGPQATPELRSLHPLSPIFSKARKKVLAAAQAAEAERTTKGETDDVMVSEILPDYPEHPERAALRRCAELADRLRPKKPRLADDPVSLDGEARRWTGALSKAQLLTLHRVLALGEVSAGHPHRGPENVPLLGAAFIRDACRRLPEDVRQTNLVVFQAVVRASAGWHAWEELRRACRDYLDARKERWQKIRREVVEMSIQAEQARAARASEAVPRISGATMTGNLAATAHGAEATDPATPPPATTPPPTMPPPPGPAPRRPRRGR